MKKNYALNGLAILAVAGLVTATSRAVAQDSTTTMTNQPAPQPVSTPATSAPTMAYGVAQIVQLTQAKVGDDTIVAYVRNSGNSYGLDANQIIYLRQQGVSDPVITAMLAQPRPGVAPDMAAKSSPDDPGVAMSSTPAPAMDPGAPGASVPAYASTATVPPAVTCVQSPPTYYYSQPYCYNPYYYGYGWYPGIGVSFVWGGGFHGGGFHGGGGHR